MTTSVAIRDSQLSDLLGDAPQPRIRVRGDPDTITDLIFEHIGLGKPPVVFASYKTDARTEVMQDVVVPGFAKRIARGDIINNPCSMAVEELSTEGSGYGLWTNTTTGGVSHSLAGPLTEYFLNRVITSPFTDLTLIHDEQLASESDAKVRALSNIDTTPYAFGEDLGEIGETLKFLKRPFGSMYDLAADFRTHAKRGVKGGLSQANAFASAWAEYWWAFKPLVTSVAEASEALSTHLTQRTAIHESARLTARGFSRSTNFNQVVDTVELDSNPGITATFFRSYEEETGIHAYILYQVSNPVRDLKHHLGFRIKDFPHTLWQLLPLSFMVDRMIDVSTFVQAFTAITDPKVKIVAAGVVTKQETINIHKILSDTHPTFTSSIEGDIKSERNFTYKRALWEPSALDAVPPVHLGRIVKDAQSIVDIAAILIGRLTNLAI